MQLNKTSLGLAFGVISGIAIFLATVWTAWRGGGDHLSLLNQFYIGYHVTYVGAFVGLVYGFVGGFVGGWLLAWLYNSFAASKAT